MILQGMCTFSWLPTRASRTSAIPPGSVRLRARFTKPVQVGDVIRLEGRCIALEGSTVKLEMSARNQRGEEVLKGAVAEGRVEER